MEEVPQVTIQTEKFKLRKNKEEEKEHQLKCYLLMAWMGGGGAQDSRAQA